MLVGLVVTFAGKLLWKIVHFIYGFSLSLTCFWIMIYPIYVKKGYRVDWMLWPSYIVSLILSVVFGFLLTKFPKGGCMWVAGWAGFVMGSDLIYNVVFTYVNNTRTYVFWIVTIPCALILAIIVWKTKKKEEKVYHMICLTPIVGGELCVLSYCLLRKNSPHSLAYAEIIASLDD